MAMRRVLLWYLPLVISLSATAVFGYGFVNFLQGRIGEPVDWLPARTATAEAPRNVIAPIILGDSLARGTGDETGLGIGGRLSDEMKRRRIPSKNVVNIAVNGARTADLTRQLESHNVRSLIGQANVVIISIGGNDLWGGSDWRTSAPTDPDAVMGEVMGRIEGVVKSVRAANPKARIFLIGLYNPFRATPFGATLTAHVNQWNGKLMDRFGSDPNFTLVPTADIFSHRDRLALDRFHPGGEGYALIARRIADSL